MIKLLNIAKLLMIKSVSELGSWSFRQFIKCKQTEKKNREKKNNYMSFIPYSIYCLIPIFKHLSTDVIGKREREGEREREGR